MGQTSICLFRQGGEIKYGIERFCFLYRLHQFLRHAEQAQMRLAKIGKIITLWLRPSGELRSSPCLLPPRRGEWAAPFEASGRRWRGGNSPIDQALPVEQLRRAIKTQELSVINYIVSSQPPENQLFVSNFIQQTHGIMPSINITIPDLPS